MNLGKNIRLLGIPVRIELWFVITILFLGLNRIEGRDKPLFWLLEWFAVAAFSIVVHEFGHAFAYKRYGQRPSIVLWGLGGLTYGEETLPPKRSIVVSAAGPLTGILLVGIPFWFLYNSVGTSNRDLRLFLYDMWWLNIVWGVVNLLPILPLDGGHITESIFEIVRGEPRRQTVRIISVVTGFLLGIVAVTVWGSFYGLFFGWILAIINAVQYYQVKNGSIGGAQYQFEPERPTDRDDANIVSMSSARKKRDRRSAGDLIDAAYDALERRDYKAVLRTTDRLKGKRLNHAMAAETAELSAWAWLGERNPVKAADELAQLPRGTSASAPIDAVLALAGKDTERGVGLMVRTMVDEPESRSKLIAVDLFAEYGMIHRLARELVDLPGGSGFESAVSLEGLLHRLHRTQDASTVSDVIMLG